MAVTNKTIEYKSETNQYVATIPKGTVVTPSEQFDKYWVGPWDYMTPRAQRWMVDKGFLIDINEVEHN